MTLMKYEGSRSEDGSLFIVHITELRPNLFVCRKCFKNVPFSTSLTLKHYGRALIPLDRGRSSRTGLLLDPRTKEIFREVHYYSLHPLAMFGCKSNVGFAIFVVQKCPECVKEEYSGKQI